MLIHFKEAHLFIDVPFLLFKHHKIRYICCFFFVLHKKNKFKESYFLLDKNCTIFKVKPLSKFCKKSLYICLLKIHP